MRGPNHYATVGLSEFHLYVNDYLEICKTDLDPFHAPEERFPGDNRDGSKEAH